MKDNRLTPHANAIGEIIARTLPPGVGYYLVLVDLKNEDLARHTNLDLPERPASIVLEAVLNFEKLRASGVLIPAGLLDPTGGVLPRAGVRSLPSGRKL